MKISIIVPVYNADRYLEKCMDSVRGQTYSDWEMILIDDGSSDRSADIADHAAEQDSRIRVIHQENAGPGIARNRGIKEAAGDYIVFLDADDYVDLNYLQLLVPKAMENDVVFIDVLQVDPQGQVLAEERMSRFKVLSKEDLIRCQMTGKMPWGGVRKAVRRSLLTENGIAYSQHLIGEEALYSFRVLSAAKQIDFLDTNPVYYYVNHEGSQSKLASDDPWGGVVRTLRDYIRSTSEKDLYATAINSFAYTALCVSVFRISCNYPFRKAVKLARQAVRAYRKEFPFRVDRKCLERRVRVLLPFLKMNCMVPVVLASKAKKRLSC